MIISHKNKVIYIRLQKVASTSFETAFSKYCGPKDIITRLGRNYDKVRKDLGYANEQNVRKGIMRKRIFRQHYTAALIKSGIPKDIWSTYMKVATVRNPYEVMISLYCDTFRNRSEKEKPTFEEFIRQKRNSDSGIARFLYDPIHIEGKSVIDFYIRYEHMTKDIKQLEIKIDCPGLSETMQRFSFNSESRSPQKHSLSAIYSKYPKAKLIIDEDLYENLDKYDFLREHWHIHKF